MFEYFRKYDRRLWVLAAGWLTSAVGFSLVIPFLAIYFHSELGMSLTEIGLFFGVAAIVRAIFQALGGELSDRLGRYYLMVGAQSLRTITFLLIAYTISHNSGFFSMAILIIINSILGALFQPAANAAVADLVEPKQRTEGYSIIRVAGNFGWAVGPALGGFLVDRSYSILFVLSAVMTLSSSIIIAIFLRGIRSTRSTNNKFKFRELISIGENGHIFKLAALMFVLYLVISQLMAPLSLFTVDFIGISKNQLGYLYTINGLMVTLLQIPTTRLLRKVRLTVQLLIGAMIYAIGYFWIGLNSTFLMFVVGILIITTGENMVSPPALALTANMAPKDKIGRYMGIYGFAVTGGWSMGPLLGGLLLDWAKPQFIYAWSVISIIALMAAFGFMMLTRRLPEQYNRFKGTQ
jgi:MFS family permease